MSRKNVKIEVTASLFDALKKMDEINRKLLIVVKDNRFISLLSIGDIQRGMLKSIALEDSIDKVLRKDIFVGKEDNSKEELINMLLKQRVEFIPIISKKNEVLEILFWEDYSNEQIFKTNALAKTPVVIMAGGLGSRLKPLTNIIPKPLVPLGEKPIIQIIIERFMAFGCTEFYISVNYKGEMIQSYLSELNLNCKIVYFEEDKPLGTAGGLSLIRHHLTSDFFVSNCDILIDQDYLEVMEYHRTNNNELTAIAAVKKLTIPYGIFETEVNGKLSVIREKPSYTFQVNAGIYILSPKSLTKIPKNEFYNITTLIENLMSNNNTVGIFPVSEGAWMDIGEWKEYQKTQEIFKSRYL